MTPVEIESIRPFLAVAVSLLGAVFIFATRKYPNIREGCSLGVGILKFLIVLTMVPAVLSGKRLHYTLFSSTSGISIAFWVDGMGLLFAITASFLWILTTIYSIGYMRSLREHNQTRFYICFAITMSATIGVAFAANLLTLFIFYEIITFFTYPLVVHHETEEAFAAGNKYILYLLATSKAFFAPAIILTFIQSGTLDFKPNGVFPPGGNPTALVITFFLFLAGFGKAAAMPLHAWLPAAMVAPTPVTALFHAVAVVNAGVFSDLRVIFHVFGVEVMKTLNLGVQTAFIVSFTIIMGSIFALTKDNLKARLAYSTISQLAYVVLGGALLSPSGMAGGIMHFVTHAFAKITLFFCAGSIYVASRKTNISEMSGIGRKMPWTMTAFALATLSMAGVPPVGGFLSKWYLMTGSVEANEIPFLIVLTASSLLNALYFFPIVHRAFFGEPREAFHPVPQEAFHPVPQSVGAAAARIHEGAIREPSYFIVVPLFLCAVISVVLGMFPNFLLALIQLVVR